MPRLGVNEISQTERAIIVGKLQSGLKQKLIAQQHGISPSAVSKIKYKFIRIGDIGIEPTGKGVSLQTKQSFVGVVLTELCESGGVVMKPAIRRRGSSVEWNMFWRSF